MSDVISHTEQYRGYTITIIRGYDAPAPYDYNYGWTVEHDGRCVDECKHRGCTSETTAIEEARDAVREYLSWQL